MTTSKSSSVCFDQTETGDGVVPTWWFSKGQNPGRTFNFSDASQEPLSFSGDRTSMKVKRSRQSAFISKEVVPKKKWHGSVTEILSDGFVARFQTEESDKKAVIAEFDFDEVSDDDLCILAVGAPLVWAIYSEREKGGLKNTSTLFVRRIIPPNEDAIKRTSDRLHEWFTGIDDDTSPAR